MLKIRYEKETSWDCAEGGFRICFPTQGGWINYNFVHSVEPKRAADTWRLSVAEYLNEGFQRVTGLTKPGAEWEMAIRLKDRCDFIGGYNHGDEKYTGVLFRLDGKRVTPEELSELREAEEFFVRVESEGYDPNLPSKPVLEHQKEYTFSEGRVFLRQRVSFLSDEALDGRFYSFLAMMPPLKREGEVQISDSYVKNGEILPLPAALSNREESLTVAGRESGFFFTMGASGYSPRYENAYHPLVTDNGGLNYNKMYLAFGGKSLTDRVKKGEIWQAETEYRIEKKQ